MPGATLSCGLSADGPLGRNFRAPAPAIVPTVGWSLVTDGTLNKDQRCCCTSLLCQRSGSSQTTYWHQANTSGDRLLPDDLTLLSRDLAA